MNRLVVVLIMITSVSCNKSHYADKMNISFTLLGDNLQMLEVKTPHVVATKGKMYLYERRSINDKFEVVDSFDVTIGRSGFAWDNEAPIKSGFQRIKHEGDGCSPAGMFTLGTVFSYHTMNGLNMPFIQVDESDICVDDANSIYYNQLIKKDSTQQIDYNSFENMKRSDELYEYGVWVNYNADPAIPGNGSCIFLHVWKDENTPTSGCTAMSRENMLKLIKWLDAKKNPVLLQYPDM